MPPAPSASPPSTAPPAPPAPSAGPPPRSESGNLALIVVGLIILIVGGYYLLRETFGMDLPDIGELWPVFVIILGVAIIYGGLRRDRA
jgi:hypothetical protein